MPGKLVSTMITLLLTTYLILLVVFYFLHENIKENVNQINYSVAETVSTSGLLSKDLYDFLYDRVNKFGNYTIKLKLEKQIKQGVYDIYFDKNDIVDKYLSIGDRLTIYLEDKNPTIFGRLINSTFLAYSPDKQSDLRIKSMKTAIIAKNAKNIVKGYNVISDISDKSLNDSIAIKVVTKLNADGKYYGSNSHAYVDTTNLYYGDSDDEVGNTGINYIFDNGNFEKEIEYYPSGMEKLISYIQQ